MRTRDGVRTALQVLGESGLDGTTVVAPNTTRALTLLLKKTRAHGLPAEKILRELKRHGLIHINKENNAIVLHLTPAGAYRLQEILIEEIKIPKPNKWDNKWRLISFDVPIEYSRQRQKLTVKLQDLGFHMLQRSVWAYPFPCFDQLQQITSHHNLLRYCSFFEVSKVDNGSSRRLSRHFTDILDLSTN